MITSDSLGKDNFPECPSADVLVAGVGAWSQDWGANLTMGFNALKAIEN